MLRVGKAKPETWPKPAPKTRGKKIRYYSFRFFTMHLNLRNLVTSQETSGVWRGICTVKVLYSLLPLKALSLFQMRTLWHSLCQWIVMEKVTALTAYLCPASRIPSAKLLRQLSWNWTNRPQLIIYQVKGGGKAWKISEVKILSISLSSSGRSESSNFGDQKLAAAQFWKLSGCGFWAAWLGLLVA